ncbi:cholesterol transport system auxiliary component [Faunimonas pinastri]|uniref:Cholesterol transport system auxiliary component n=1 Tax=Faunimonas pinastri TaxID=1855383 RepID=A0A1H9FBK5_9HYPH|nr:ABC-type transport auxiliary lipoprotein family protein [Faunimonas pinastri]SEQ35310.1 cholesterol transport system auxiliary component [Faunimonas pinastri]
MLTRTSTTKRLLPRAALRAAILALAASLGACSLIIPPKPSSIYDLKAPPAFTVRGTSSAQLLVPTPTTLKSLDNNRIAARPTEQEYAYLPQANWVDSLPRLLQTRLSETLQNTGRVHAAAVPGQGLLIDYQIIVDIRAFELTREGAVADLDVKLMNDKTGRVVSSREFRAVAPVQGRAAEAVVAGLDQSMASVFEQITNWVIGQT